MRSRIKGFGFDSGLAGYHFLCKIAFTQGAEANFVAVSGIVGAIILTTMVESNGEEFDILDRPDFVLYYRFSHPIGVLFVSVEVCCGYIEGRVARSVEML